MTKLEQNATIFAGKDRVLRFGITGSDGNSLDQTGNTASWIMQDEEDSTTCLVKIDGLISGSLIDVKISPSDTSGLSGFYYHELAATASGSAAMLATGVLQINRSSI